MDPESYYKPESSLRNQIRFRIYHVMMGYIKLDQVWRDVVAFDKEEEKGKDRAEAIIIEMEKHHRAMVEACKELSEKMPDGEHEAFIDTPLYDGIRRTNNFVNQLNKLDLDKKTWLTVLSRCVTDTYYHHQILTLIF